MPKLTTAIALARFWVACPCLLTGNLYLWLHIC